MENILKQLVTTLNNGEGVSFLNIYHENFYVKNVPIDEAAIENAIFYCFGDTDICHEKVEIIIHINTIIDVLHIKEEEKYIIKNGSVVFEIVL